MRVFRLMAVSLLACLALAACGTSAASSQGGGNKIRLGGTLTAARAADAVTWDPANINENDSLWASQQVEATLVRVSPNGKGFLPYLAKSWSISPDGLTYTFHLYPQAKFCNGSSVTSADVLYSFKRESASSSVVAWQYPKGIQMSATNADTVVIHLPQVDAAFLSYLAIWGTEVVSKAYAEKNGTQILTTDPLGDGPFCLQAWHRGSEIDLVRNKYFWLKDSHGNRLPYLNAIHWKIIADDNARALAVQSGQVEVATPIAPAQFSQLTGVSGVKLGSSTLMGTSGVFVSVHPHCQSSVDVRQALNYAVDRKAIVNAVLLGKGTPAENPFDNANFSDNAYGYSYDLAKAKQLMKKSPCPNGFNATVLYVAGDTTGQQALTVLKAEWAKIGVNLSLQALESGTFDSTVNSEKFDMVFQTGTGDIYDPSENLDYEMLPASAGGSDASFTGWSNDQVTRLVAEGLTQSNTKKRAQIYHEIDKLFMELGPAVFLFNPKNLWATSSKVHGFSETATGAQTFATTWID